MVIALSILLTLFSLPEAVSQNSAEQLYEEALFKKEAHGDLKGAIQLFLKITVDFPEEREIGARAQIQVGICYEKLGLEQAVKAYQKVVDEYPEQADEVRLARERIAVLVKAQVLTEKGDREFMIRRIWSGPDVDFRGSPSPDGRYLSYSDWETGDLAIRELATGKKHHLTHEATWNTPQQYAFYSRISPDGKQIAFCWLTQLLDDSHSIDLRLIGLDGSSSRILYRSRDYEIFPAQWSPDGKRIAVRMYGRKDKEFQIAEVLVSDGSLHVIKRSEEEQTTQDCISYSPDGEFIAFDLPVENDSGKYDIFLLATDGSRESPLIEHTANDRLLVLLC
jgi:Tol biopolymer transport system component